MRETSGSYDINVITNSAIGDEIVKLQNKKNDIISFICMPGIRVMSEVITAWQTYLIDGKQSENPGESDFASSGNTGWEWRSHLTHQPSTMNTSTPVFGNVNDSQSTIHNWTIDINLLEKFYQFFLLVFFYHGFFSFHI